MRFVLSLSPLKASGHKWVPDAVCKWEKSSATLSYPFDGLGNQKTQDYCITQAWPACLDLPFPNQGKLNHT